MGAVCSGKRPQTSDVEDTDPPPIHGHRKTSEVNAQCIEVDDMRSDFVQVEDQVKDTKTVVHLAGERKHKLPEKYQEEKEKRRTPAAITKITTAVEADPTQIQVEDTMPLKKRTPVSSAPNKFAEDLKEDLEKKKRGPETRNRPPSIPIPPEQVPSSETRGIRDEESQPSSARSAASDRPLSTKSDISEFDSVGEIFAAELNEDMLTIEVGEGAEKKKELVPTPFNSPENPEEAEPDGDKLADLFEDDVGDDNTAILFAEEIDTKEEEEVEAKEDVVAPVENAVEVEPPSVEVEKVETTVPEKVEVSSEPEPIIIAPPVKLDEVDVFEFDEPDELDENQTEEVETPLKEANETESERAETKEETTGLHAVETETTKESMTLPANVDSTDAPSLEVKESETNEKSSDDFVTITPKSALEDMAEPVVLQNPIDHVEEVRDPSPQMKLFLVSEDGRESVRLNPAEASNLRDLVKEDYSISLGDVEETDRERDVDPMSSPREYHEMYMDPRSGKWTVKRQSLHDQALAKEEELEDIRRQMRASRSLEKLESIESMEVPTSPRETSLSPRRSLQNKSSLSPRRSRSKSPLIQRLSAKFEKPPISTSERQEEMI